MFYDNLYIDVRKIPQEDIEIDKYGGAYLWFPNVSKKQIIGMNKKNKSITYSTEMLNNEKIKIPRLAKQSAFSEHVFILENLDRLNPTVERLTLNEKKYRYANIFITEQQYLYIRNNFSILPLDLAKQLVKVKVNDFLTCYYHKEFDLAFVDHKTRIQLGNKIRKKFEEIAPCYQNGDSVKLTNLMNNDRFYDHEVTMGDIRLSLLFVQAKRKLLEFKNGTNSFSVHEEICFSEETAYVVDKIGNFVRINNEYNDEELWCYAHDCQIKKNRPTIKQTNLLVMDKRAFESIRGQDYNAYSFVSRQSEHTMYFARPSEPERAMEKKRFDKKFVTLDLGERNKETVDIKRLTKFINMIRFSEFVGDNYENAFRLAYTMMEKAEQGISDFALFEAFANIIDHFDKKQFHENIDTVIDIINEIV